MKALTLADMGFLYCETVSRPNHVAGIQIFDMPRNYKGDYIQDLYQQLMQSQEIQSPFSDKLYTAYSGLMYWKKDDKVDLEYHVREVMLPAPGSHEQLMEYVEHAHSNLLDRDRPLWEFHLISGLANNQFAVYLKMHHAFTDGAKANSMLRSYLSQQPERPLQALWSVSCFVEKTDSVASNIGLMRQLAKQGSALYKQVSAIPSIIGLGTKLLLQGANVYSANIPTPFTAPHTPFSVSPKRARRATTATLPLSRIKNIGKMAGTTVNDVVVCICDIALQHYLEDLNFKLKQPLVAQIPVSLREQNDVTSNNRIAITMVKLGEHNAAPLARLMTIKESCDKLKQEARLLSDEALTSYTLTSQGLAVISEALKLESILPPVGNVLISNVPGPRQPMYMMGARLQECYPLSALPPGMSLNITLYSYLDQLNVGLVACRTSLPDLSKISAYLEAAFNELEAVVMATAIDVVAKQIQLLEEDSELTQRMHDIIATINDSACATMTEHYQHAVI